MSNEWTRAEHALEYLERLAEIPHRQTSERRNCTGRSGTSSNQAASTAILNTWHPRPNASIGGSSMS